MARWAQESGRWCAPWPSLRRERELRGGLDPLDLATYATLVADRAVSSAVYLGISASWLDACRADLAKHARPAFQQVCIPMDAAEREGWQGLREIGVDWPDHRRGGVSLLDSGLKLEPRGPATQPYTRQHLRQSLYTRYLCSLEIDGLPTRG